MAVARNANAPNATERYGSRRLCELYFNKKFKRHETPGHRKRRALGGEGGAGTLAVFQHPGLGPWVEGDAVNWGKTQE